MKQNDKKNGGCILPVDLPKMSAEFQSNVKTISLIMRKQNAQLIKDGVKNVEFRDFTPFYDRMLIAKDKTEHVMQPINRITFRNYNKSFEMTVSVKTYGVFFPKPKVLEVIKNNPIEFPFSDFSYNETEQIVELNKDLINNNSDDPILFYFIIDKIESYHGLD